VSADDRTKNSNQNQGNQNRNNSKSNNNEPDNTNGQPVPNINRNNIEITETPFSLGKTNSVSVRIFEIYFILFLRSVFYLF
jgi:hypothetical protein